MTDKMAGMGLACSPKLLGFVLGAIGSVMLAGAPALAAADEVADGDCDRQCLSAIADNYLSALTDGEAADAPLSEDVVFTENTIRLNLGQGLWNQADGAGPSMLTIIDPVAGQVGILGTIFEGGVPRLLGARLKVTRGNISEIETIVARTGMTTIPPSPEIATRTLHPAFSETLDPSQRRGRSEMVRIANSYFEGIEQNSGDIVPFDDSCNRVENGVQTTNNAGMMPAGPDGVSPIALGCRDQFNMGGMFWTLPERRFWAVDEERGLVAVTVTFRSELPEVSSDEPAAMLGPMLAHNVIMEVFKIEDGLITQIEAVLGPMLPYGQRSGW